MNTTNVPHDISQYILDEVSWPMIVLDSTRRISQMNSSSRCMFPTINKTDRFGDQTKFSELGNEVEQIFTNHKKISIPKKLQTIEGEKIFEVGFVRIENDECEPIGAVITFRYLACGQKADSGGCQLRDRFNQSNNCFLVMDLQTGILLDANSAACRLLGYSKTELLTKYFWDIEIEVASIRLKKIFLHAIRAKGSWETDSCYRRKDGTQFPVRLHIYYIKHEEKEYAVIFAYDITLYKEMESKLQQQILFLQYVIDAIPHPVFLKDYEFRYIGCNTAFEKTFNISRSQLIGKTVHDIVRADLAAVFYQTDTILFQKKQVQIYKSEFVDYQGNQHNVIFQRTPFFNPDGTLGGLVGVIINLKEFRQLDKELETIQSIFE